MRIEVSALEFSRDDVPALEDAIGRILVDGSITNMDASVFPRLEYPHIPTRVSISYSLSQTYKSKRAGQSAAHAFSVSLNPLGCAPWIAILLSLFLIGVVVPATLRACSP